MYGTDRTAGGGGTGGGGAGGLEGANGHDFCAWRLKSRKGFELSLDAVVTESGRSK